MESGDSLTGYSLVQFSGTESLLTNSQYAKVIFHDVVEECSSEQDFVCKYSNQVSFSSQAGDRVVLFKLGWHRVTDYEIFEWAPLQTMNKNVFKVVFPADTLPKNTNEFYQLCYISGKNDICGASVPFQFCMNMFPVSLPYKDFREVIPEKTVVDQDSGTPTEILSELVRQWLLETGSTATTVSEMLNEGPSSEVLAVVQKAIDRVNAQRISNAQTIRKFVFLPMDFSIATGELGPTMKIKRNVVLEKYKTTIDQLYT